MASTNEKLYNLKNFGIHGEELVTDVGANAKMNEFCAIMGLCNLRHIDDAIARRAKKNQEYREGLKAIRGIRFWNKRQVDKDNFAYFPLVIEEEYRKSRDELYTYLKKNNIYARKYFYPLTADQMCYKGKFEANKLENARMLAQQVISLPFYEEIEWEQLGKIVEIIGEGK